MSKIRTEQSVEINFSKKGNGSDRIIATITHIFSYTSESFDHDKCSM